MVEFTLLSLLLMVPLVYITNTVALVQYGCKLAIPLINFPHFNNC